MKTNSLLLRTIGIIAAIIPLHLIERAKSCLDNPLELRDSCPQGSCIECVGTNHNMQCIKCKFLVTDSENKTCGVPIKYAPEYYGIQKSLIKNCEGLEMQRNSARCFLCEEGYVLSTEGKCKKNLKMNCRLQQQVQKLLKFDSGEETVVKLEKCLICKNHFPYLDNKSVIQNKELEIFGKCNHEIDQSLFKGCKFGTVGMKAGKLVHVCAGCEKKTEAVVMDENNSKYGKCEIFPQDMLGCGRMKSGQCTWCNHYSGYYMVRPGICEKQGSIYNTQVVAALIIFSMTFKLI